MAFKNYREETKKNWGSNDPDSLTLDQIQTGCMLRIADATELMARRYQDLIDDRDRYKRWYENQQQENAKLVRSNNAYKGIVKKLKKK